MKRSITTLALVWMATALCMAGTHVTVRVSGINADSLLVDNAPLSGNEQLPGIRLAFHENTATYQVDNTVLAVSQVVVTGKKGERHRLLALLVPGHEAELIVNGATGTFTYSDDELYGRLAHAQQVVAPYEARMQELNDIYRTETARPGANADSIGETLTALAQSITNEEIAAVTGYINANPDEDGSAYLLQYIDYSDSEEGLALLRSNVALLSERVRGGDLAPLVDYLLKGADKEEARLLQQKNVADGKPAIDFTLKDLQGKDFTLSSLRGKWVVIDFWGSWCIWCIRGIPSMKDTYNKYKASGKLEFVSVACRDTDAKWRAAVQKHALPWVNVFNPQGDGDITGLYAIQGFPTKVIVDPQGNIYKTVVGEDPEFYSIIDEVMSR